jgi:Dolichyl-phosphate-mannose-protein mannosyltransferase
MSHPSLLIRCCDGASRLNVAAYATRIHQTSLLRAMPVKTGHLVVLGGLTAATLVSAWIAGTELRRESGTPSVGVTLKPPSELLEPEWWWALALVIVVGTIVRLYGLDLKGLSHPEAYIPGLNLPAGISEPPPRHGFVETLRWHVSSEPHPFGYYMAMWAWTKAFGTSLTAIRAPEAILGVLSLWLIFKVGALTFGTRVGIVASALLSLHGFHIFWSQAARMYVPGAFLGLLSTWLLLTMSRQRRPPPWLEAGYLLTTLAGVMTVEFFWPFFGVQILWLALANRTAPARGSRIASIQVLAFILSAPMLSLSALLGRNNAAPAPSLEFLTDFLSFGFLFDHGAWGVHGRAAMPLAVVGFVLILGVALLVRGLGVTPLETVVESSREPLRTRPLVFAACSIALVMLGIAPAAEGRQNALAALSVLPLLALLIPAGVGMLIREAQRLAPRSARWLDQHPEAVSLVALLALVPTPLIFVASYKLTLTAPRAFLIFVPYVLILVAAGVVALARTRLRAVAIAVPLLAMFSASAVILHRTPISFIDYRGLSDALSKKMQSDDLIFVQPRSWEVTPFFYYLDQRRLVAADYSEVLRKAPQSRVWAFVLPDQKPTQPMIDALSGHRIAERIDAWNAHAILYIPSR